MHPCDKGGAMSSTLRAASKDTLQVKDKTYHYYSLALAAKQLGDLTRLPKSLKVLLENLLTLAGRRFGHRTGHSGAGRLAGDSTWLTAKSLIARHAC